MEKNTRKYSAFKTNINYIEIITNPNSTLWIENMYLAYSAFKFQEMFYLCKSVGYKIEDRF